MPCANSYGCRPRTPPRCPQLWRLAVWPGHAKLAAEVRSDSIELTGAEQPPSIPPSSDFRTLPDPERESLEPDTLLALREAKALRESARQLGDGQNPAERQIWRDLHASPDDVLELARQARQTTYLGKATGEAMDEYLGVLPD
jgi:hypothetical protein